jgi:two-component system sensor kinase FixL
VREAEIHRHERETGQQRDQLAHLARVASLGELSASLAHELNQPLTAILSNAQAGLRMLQQGGNDEEVRAALQDIVEDDRRASEVIRRLRGMLIKEQAELRELDVNELVREVLRLYRSDLLNRRITLELALAPGLPPVRGDRVQLQQVLLNLLINAADAMTGLERRTLFIDTGRHEDAVRVKVRDTGAGIADGDLERVFEPFVSTKPTGLGLGLAVCRTIVDVHRGRLWAERNPGGGASFQLELPSTA